MLSKLLLLWGLLSRILVGLGFAAITDVKFSITRGSTDDSVTFNCSAKGLIQFQAISIYKVIKGGQRKAIKVNTRMREPFRSLARYQNGDFSQDKATDTTTLTFSIQGVKEGDGGTYRCTPTGVTQNYDQVLTVYGPVTDVYFTSYSSNAHNMTRYAESERVDYGAKSMHLMCVVTIDHSNAEPIVHMYIENKIISTTFKDVKNELTETYDADGFGNFSRVKMFAWVGNVEKTQYNNKRLICSANAPGFPQPKESSIVLNILFDAKIDCPGQFLAYLNSEARMTCQIKANPFEDNLMMTFKWSIESGKTTLGVGQRKPGYDVEVNVVDNFTRNITLIIEKANKDDFRQYELSVEYKNKPNASPLISSFSLKKGEADINECDSSPCMENGQCLNMIGSYSCKCNAGFTGDNCETNIDDCHSIPCLNNGICKDATDSYTCQCKDGYNGTHCENDIRNECQSSPCKNNGTCIDGIASYRCECHPGFIGLNCEDDIRNECQSSPCKNNGTCFDGIASYRCECRPGFIGLNCVNEATDSVQPSTITPWIIIVIVICLV